MFLILHFLYLQSSQKELPQQGIITASTKIFLQMPQIKSSGISCSFSVDNKYFEWSESVDLKIKISNSE